MFPFKDLTYFTGRQHVVHVLEEAFVFDFVVRKNEGDSVAFVSGCPVQHF